MKMIMRIIFSFVCIAITMGAHAAKLNPDKKSINTVMFFTEEDQAGVRVIAKGIVQNVGVREFSTDKEREIGRPIQDRTKISVRLYENNDVMAGALLYVINDRNLVVAKLSVLDVFKSASFDYMCVGYGNFRAVKKDFRVVQKVGDNSVSAALTYIAQAYRELEQKDLSRAIEFFQKAVESDKSNPEAHAGLGYIYLEQKLIPFAVKEFDAAYKNKLRVYDREERFLLIRGCAESRYMGVFQSELLKGHKTREKYLDEGIAFAREAAAMNNDSAESHFMLGRFYYDRSTDALTKIETENDMKAVASMSRVLELQKDNLEACIVVAKIYKKHDNKDKALSYIDRARKINPANVDARDLEKAIKSMK